MRVLLSRVFNTCRLSQVLSKKNVVSLKLSPLSVQGKRWIQLCTTYPFDNYELERKNFHLDVPEYFNFAHDFIDGWAAAEQSGKRESDVPAFWWVDSVSKKEIKWSFQQLSQQSKRVANALTGGCGLQRGDKVIVILPKIPEWWLLNLACIRADIILSPGTTLLRSKDIRHRLKLSGAQAIITSPELSHYVDEGASDIERPLTKILVGEQSETRPGWVNYHSLVEKASADFQTAKTKATDPMTLFFTSGTTGAPKMAELSHASYGLGHTLTARYFLQSTSRSVVWNLSDTGWAKCAWSSLFAAWIHGSCVFIYNSAAFDPAETLQVLASYPVTHFCSAPSGYRLLVTQSQFAHRYPALKYCFAAGEPSNPEMIELWKKGTGLDIHEGYGQTETTLICARYACIDYKPGSMGKASPGIDLAVVDDDGNVLERGTEGNLAVKVKPHRPVGLFTHYLNEPERTAAVFRGDYYLLGDRCYMDEEDYVYFVGRADDVIISSGYRIGPFEVESALLEHPAVLESAVVSSPDDIRGEVVKAFVILSPDYRNTDPETLDLELKNHVKTVTAPYKYPRRIEFVTELPKTISGKIRRVELRNKEWNKE
ncbi:acyl-coenzyme A synthetase ACSM3, mitochondrial isoform X1 [Aplysia californica]|uniref:medium-chain acyl-CoA ligase n=1 Tax=Aplysia californica TaxID=6500 RepID=A0ABM1A7M3_APLCA|nr:acyl-coenzyme A synthetase ACSM3, mitochondrial isoform X1 [Aplysia californica]XP_005106394.1 acyl-coenzyme A synthetase ACSM3, mitochondrial isoform X1 [Aplysia californica]XP_012942412.1 acyl-coenzyme A synthetase ACSM3, mitochondrial isoform X1 [Aplysia californica]